MRLRSLEFDIDHYLNPLIPPSQIHKLPTPISWFLGHHENPRLQTGSVIVWLWSFVGAFCGIATVEAVFQTDTLKAQGAPVIIASLGATAILEYNVIDSPLSQPRNVFVGQIISSVVGVCVTKLFQLSPDFENLRWLAGALAVGISSASMGFTKTVHPPAGATALLTATTPEITAIGWFLIPLVIIGNVLILAVACLINNVQRTFPIYWWTPMDVGRSTKSDIEKAPTNKQSSESIKLEQSNNRSSQIIIRGNYISVPDSITLGDEEYAVLEILRGKLRQVMSDGSCNSFL